MEKVILKKEEGKVTRTIRTDIVAPCSYLTDSELCFPGMLKNTVNKSNKRDVTAIRNTINGILSEVSRIPQGEKVIEIFYKALKNVRTDEDLMNFIGLINNTYDEVLKMLETSPKRRERIAKVVDIREREGFYDEIRNNPYIVLSIAIKRVISTYYLNKLLSMGREKVEEIENLKISGVSDKEIMTEIGEEFSEAEYKTGIATLSTKIAIDTVDKAYDRLQKHLCWDECDCATVTECPKVADCVKKTIDKYDFITDGYQIMDSQGKVDHFIVTGCERYKKASGKRL